MLDRHAKALHMLVDVTAERDELKSRLAVENAESMRQYNEMGLRIDLERAEQDVARLKVIICETAREVGAALSTQASIEFMCELPLQARAFVRRAEADLAETKSALEDAIACAQKAEARCIEEMRGRDALRALLVEARPFVATDAQDFPALHGELLARIDEAVK